MWSCCLTGLLTQQGIFHLTAHFNPVEEAISKMKYHVKQQHSVNRTHLLRLIDEGILTVTRSDCHGYVEHTKQFYDACLDRREVYNDVSVDKTPKGTVLIQKVRLTQTLSVKNNSYSCMYTCNHCVCVIYRHLYKDVIT